MNNKNREIVKNLSLITQLGLNSIIPMLFGVWLGMKLDKLTGKNYLFTISLLVLGAMTAVFNIYKLAITKGKKNEDE